MKTPAKKATKRLRGLIARGTREGAVAELIRNATKRARRIDPDPAESRGPGGASGATRATDNGANGGTNGSTDTAAHQQRAGVHQERAGALRIVTYNIHKGFSHFNRRMMVHELRDTLRHMDADIVFLQEVVGEHERHATRFDNWPVEPQYEFLAKDIWSEFAYGRNRDHAHGHHGNAVLSRYPILTYENQNISAHNWEKRGVLHCEIEMPGFATPVHCMCVHLALNENGRRYQVGALVERLEREVPEGEPVIIAGDFNDWRNLAGNRLADSAGLFEAFRDHRGSSARSFPSNFPLLRLDRIYLRGFRVEHTEVHHGLPWSRISDHAALSARLVRTS